MDIARDICTDSFYIVNSGLPCIAVTAVPSNFIQKITLFYKTFPGSITTLLPWFLHLCGRGSAWPLRLPSFFHTASLRFQIHILHHQTRSTLPALRGAVLYRALRDCFRDKSCTVEWLDNKHLNVPRSTLEYFKVPRRTSKLLGVSQSTLEYLRVPQIPTG